MNNIIDPRTVLSHSISESQQTDSSSRDLKRLQEAGEQFETFFLMEMFKAMRKAVPDGGLFEKSVAKDIFQEMFDMEAAKATAQHQPIGVGDAIYRQMSGLIENTKGERSEE